MKSEKQKTKMSYDPESDVLRVELSKKPIDYATEIGSFVVHFSPKDLPVYIEILEAKKFLRRTERILSQSGVQELTLRQ